MSTVLNIFDQDAFGVVEFTEEVVRRTDYKPQLLGSLNLFQPIYSRSRVIGIAKKDGVLNLIPTSEVGAPPEELVPEGSDLRTFRTRRLAKGSTILAESLQGVAALPFDEAVKDVQTEVAGRASEIMDDMELTWEHMRLGAVQGIVYDADNATVINNWFSEWGIAAPAEINFALGTASTDVRGKCTQLVRAMKKAAKGVWTPTTKVHALVGDAFFDALISHPNVEKFYLNYVAAQDLRGDGQAYGDFEFGAIVWHNYQGTDDGSTIAIGTDQAKFFPVGARGAFQVGWSPAEFFPYVNQRAQETYGMVVKDLQRDAWRRPEVYSYPLFICTRPEMLYSGRRA